MNRNRYVLHKFLIDYSPTTVTTNPNILRKLCRSFSIIHPPKTNAVMRNETWITTYSILLNLVSHHRKPFSKVDPGIVALVPTIDLSQHKYRPPLCLVITEFHSVRPKQQMHTSPQFFQAAYYANGPSNNRIPTDDIDTEAFHNTQIPS